jgi:hypothetical protein
MLGENSQTGRQAGRKYNNRDSDPAWRKYYKTGIQASRKYYWQEVKLTGKLQVGSLDGGKTTGQEVKLAGYTTSRKLSRQKIKLAGKSS